MKLQDFTGGLSIRLRPQFLLVNEGVKYENIDSRVGTLVPVKSKVLTEEELEEFNYYYDAEKVWVSNSIQTDYLEYSKKLYYTDRIGRPQVFDGEDRTNLGIVRPEQLETFSVNEHAEKLKELSITTGAGGLLKTNAYYAIVNANDNKYSLAMEILVDSSNQISVLSTSAKTLEPRTIVTDTTGSRSVTLSNAKGINIGNGGVRIYRLYTGKYYLVSTLGTATSSFTDTIENISANEELDQNRIGVLVGTLQYGVTFLNSKTGVESAMSQASIELEITNSGTVTIGELQVSEDPQVDMKRLYRIGGNFTAFTRVAELTNLTANFLDNVADLDVSGALASTIGDGEAPEGLSFLTEAYAMLFGAVDNQLYFTPIGQPYNWPALNFLTYESDITGIAITANGLLVMTRLKTFIVTGTTPTSLATRLLSGDQGCVAFSSIVNIDTAALWVSTDGICLSNGAGVEVLTKDKLGMIAISPMSSVVHDEIYYISSGKGVLAFDFGIGKIFKTFVLGVSTLSVANDKVYGWKDGFLHELFVSDEPENFTYLSPRFIEGRATELKTYKKVYIYSKGDIIIDILINDKLVCTATLTGEDAHTIQVPQEFQRGFFIQFAISGTGEVYELEYTVGDRAND